MNTHSSDVCAGIKLPITDSDVCDVRISVECVYDAFSHLKQRKIDSSGLDSSHLILALPVIAEILFFGAQQKLGLHFVDRCLLLAASSKIFVPRAVKFSIILDLNRPNRRCAHRSHKVDGGDSGQSLNK